jgi:hypothetical protein
MLAITRFTTGRGGRLGQERLRDLESLIIASLLILLNFT